MNKTKYPLVPAGTLALGTLFATLDLIDGERRIKFFMRGHDEPHPGKPWVRAKGLGYMQYRENDSLRARVRVAPDRGSTLIGELTPVIALRLCEQPVKLPDNIHVTVLPGASYEDTSDAGPMLLAPSRSPK